MIKKRIVKRKTTNFRIRRHRRLTIPPTFWRCNDMFATAIRSAHAASRFGISHRLMKIRQDRRFLRRLKNQCSAIKLRQNQCRRLMNPNRFLSRDQTIRFDRLLINRFAVKRSRNKSRSIKYAVCGRSRRQQNQPMEQSNWTPPPAPDAKLAKSADRTKHAISTADCRIDGQNQNSSNCFARSGNFKYALLRLLLLPDRGRLSPDIWQRKMLNKIRMNTAEEVWLLAE